MFIVYTSLPREGYQIVCISYINSYHFLQLAVKPSPKLWQANKKMFCQTPLIQINLVFLCVNQKIIFLRQISNSFYLKDLLFKSYCLPTNLG